MVKYVMFSGVVLVALGTASFAADKDKKNERPPKLSPQMVLQLKAMFDRVDRDRDGFLDADEVAKMFRGPSAKAPPPAKIDLEGNEETPKPGKPNIPAMPLQDQLFIQSYDKDGDAKISYAEFERAGANYEEQMNKASPQRKQFGGGRGGNYMQQYQRQWQELMKRFQQQQGKQK